MDHNPLWLLLVKVKYSSNALGLVPFRDLVLNPKSAGVDVIRHLSHQVQNTLKTRVVVCRQTTFTRSPGGRPRVGWDGLRGGQVRLHPWTASATTSIAAPRRAASYVWGSRLFPRGSLEYSKVSYPSGNLNSENVIMVSASPWADLQIAADLHKHSKT